MRSFSANFEAERAKRGTAPLNYIYFSGLDAYVSDVDRTISGVPFAGIVSSWGFIDTNAGSYAGAGLLGRIETADLQIELINHDGAFSDQFAASAVPLENVDVNVYQNFKGLSASAGPLIFNGVVGGQPEYDLRTCRLTIKSVWQRYNKLIGDDLIITAADFPGADPDDIGQMRNLLWGSCRNVRCRAVAAGMVDLLRDDLSAAATSFYLSGSTPANMASGTRVVQIDAEKISGTWNPSTRQMTSCTRGYGSTTAVAHDKGSAVAEVLTSYVYELASHPVKTIGAVLVDGVLQASGYTAYTGQSGSELAGYEGTAVIAFSARPTVTKQVNLALTDDTLAVSTGSHSHDGGDAIGIWKFQHIDSYTDLYFPEAVIDGSFSTGAFFLDIHATATYSRAEYQAFGPAPVAFRLCMTLFTSSSGGTGRLTFGGHTLDVSTPGATGKSSWYTPTSAQDTWTEFNNLTATISYVSGNWEVRPSEIWIEVKYNTAVTSAATGVALSGDNVTLTGNSSADTVIGRIVTVDVDGAKDDAGGTITGTANALIERPDHVFKALWINTLSAPSGGIDSTAFTAAGSFYNSNSYKFGLAITRPVIADELLLRLALQCRSRFVVTPAGTARLLVRQTGQSSVLSIPKKEIKSGSAKMRRTASEDIINAFTIIYDRDWSRDGIEAYAGAISFADATSISDYGRREWRGQADLFWFDAVSGEAMAQDVGDFLLEWHSTARAMPEFSVFLDNMEVEPGDIIDITHDLDSMTNFTGEVVKIRHTLGSAKRSVIDHLTITMVEV